MPGTLPWKLKTGEGLNALTGEYGDMLKFGVPDPAKVTRSALENAASILAMLLTTEILVADNPSLPRRPAAAAPPWVAWVAASKRLPLSTFHT